MASNIRLVTTRLENSGKRGELTPDANGYFEIVLGGLNIHNSVGDFYTADTATQLFQEQSDLMRRLRGGNLYGECGHPKQLPGQSMDDYTRRIMYVEETNFSHHFADIQLDPDFGKKNPQFNNPNIIGIIGYIKPFGARAAELDAALRNPKQNVNFSIRALSRNTYRAGVNQRSLEHIITWDWVTEPGLAVANKWDSPALESFTDIELTERTLSRIIETTPSAVAMESAMQTARIAQSLIREDKARVSKPAPAYRNW